MNMLRRLYVIIGFLWVCVVFTHFTLIRPVVAATQEIVAVVNENAISDSDLRKRLRLIMASSGLPDTKEIRQKLTQQVLSGLINEQLMLQEAKKFGIEISRWI